jgi:hypothetical protein
MDLELELTICNKFAEIYLRNNKSKTKKNMRCFPHCGDDGHRDQGFCGSPVSVSVSDGSKVNSQDLASLVVFGGIHCSIQQPACVVGQLIDEKDLPSFAESNSLLSGTHMHVPFKGEFSISPGRRKGWTYMWNNNRGRGKVCHYFWVCAFKKSAGGSLVCVGCCQSSGFEVCSSKRTTTGPTIPAKRYKPMSAAFSDCEPKPTILPLPRRSQSHRTIRATVGSVMPFNPPNISPDVAPNDSHHALGIPVQSALLQPAACSVDAVCATFDKLALELSMMERFLQCFTKDDAANIKEVQRDNGVKRTPLDFESLSAVNCKPLGVSAFSVSSLQALFESMYTRSGSFNQLFRNDINMLAEQSSEQLLTGRFFYEATVLTGIRCNSSDVLGDALGDESKTFLNSDAMTTLLHRFMNLGMEQMQLICKIHSVELEGWLTSSTPSKMNDLHFDACSGSIGLGAESCSSGSGLTAITRTASGAIGFEPVPASSVDPGSVGIETTPHLIAFLRHIGRVDPDLVFLLSLAEMKLSCETQVQLQTPLSLSQLYPSSPPSLGGCWTIRDNQNYAMLERSFAEAGYPWFARQLFIRLSSSLCVTDTGYQISFATAGNFLGHKVINVSERVPPIVCQYQVSLGQPKFKLCHRGVVGNVTIDKLGYRFVNSHTNLIRSDGSAFAELIVFDPKHFFSGGASLQEVFDVAAMRRWTAHLYDVDESGLPKEMIKEQWYRSLVKMTPVRINGQLFMDVEMVAFEYDHVSGEWSRFRCIGNIQYKQQEPLVGRGAVTGLRS